MNPKKPKGLSYGLGFQFFQNLGLSILQNSCKFRIKKNLVFKYVFEYKF